MIILLFYLLAIPIKSTGQYIFVELKAEITDSLLINNIHFFDIDNLGNLYIVKKNGELEKRDLKGNILKNFRASNKLNLLSIDVKDPMKIMLFYNNLPELVFLDIHLAETSAISLFRVGMENIDAVAFSSDNSVWLIDVQVLKLYKINSSTGQTITQNTLSRSLEIHDYTGVQLKEISNRLFLNIPDFGIMLYDNFGNYKSSIEYKNISCFDLDNDQLVFIQNGKPFLYSLPDFTLSKIIIKDTNQSFINVKTYNQKYYFQTENKIYEISINKQ